MSYRGSTLPSRGQLRWTVVNLPTPSKPAPQDHLGFMVVLTDVVTRLHTAEELRPVMLRQVCILGLNGYDAIVEVVLVCLACGFLFFRPLRD